MLASMDAQTLRSRTLPLALGFTLALACRAPLDDAQVPWGRTPAPIPTEHVLDEDAERVNKRERLAWIEEMHRHAPDVDWRAIEERNRETELWRRNQLATASQATLGARRWEEVGSNNQAGHVRCAAIGPERDGVRGLYVGSALGGVWRAYSSRSPSRLCIFEAAPSMRSR